MGPSGKMEQEAEGFGWSRQAIGTSRRGVSGISFITVYEFFALIEVSLRIWEFVSQTLSKIDSLEFLDFLVDSLHFFHPSFESFQLGTTRHCTACARICLYSCDV
jgi:hypothetical protein